MSDQNSRATNDILDALHGLQAEALRDYLNQVRTGEAELVPAILAQINKFLKDNGIDRPYADTNGVDQLDKELQAFEEENIDVLPFKKRG